jgi:hypothetical protein
MINVVGLNFMNILKIKRRKMTRQTILPPEMRGVMKVSGYRGVGKTSLLAQADIPDNVAFFDFENKGLGFHNQLNFGLYKAMSARDPDVLYQMTMDAFDELEQDRYTVAILDNGSPLELALQAGAARDIDECCRLYGLNKKNVLAGRMGGLRSVVNFLITDKICNKLHSKGINLIGVTHHIKPRWSSGGPIPNKMRIKGSDKWQELSILSVVLIPGEFSPIPTGLIQKEQLSTIKFDTEAMTFTQQRRLPYRMPKCTFAEIRRYLEEPANLDDPPVGEVIVNEEVDVFTDKFSKDQLTVMKLQLEQAKREAGEDVAPVALGPNGKLHQEKVAKATEMKKINGRSNLEIAKETGLSIAEVVKL